MEYPHRPVMVNETIRALITLTNGIYVDGTVGSGGHSEALGREIGSKGRLICLDRDPDAVRMAGKRLGSLGDQVTVLNANYIALGEVLRSFGISRVNGILLDLGLSSYQLEQSERGFSFMRDEPLDMRMDPREEITAHKLVNELSRKEIKTLLREYGEEKRAGVIARTIERSRKREPIASSLQLASLIRSVSPRKRPGAIDSATRTFQALRIAVNRELENLTVFLEKVPSLIETGGRLVFLSYHSLEDRLIKQTMKKWETGCTCPPDLPQCGCGGTPLFHQVYSKGIKPDKREIEDNPRSRSARLRAAERI